MSQQQQQPQLPKVQNETMDVPTFRRMQMQDIRNRNVDQIPLPTDPSGFYATLMNDTDMVVAKKRFVKVSGTGEVAVEPDTIEFVVQIVSIKPSLIDARTSIKKREEYILGAMKKNHIRDVDIVPSEMVRRANSENPEDDDLDQVAQEYAAQNDQERFEAPIPKFFRICKELHVHCDNLIKYLQVTSLCNEKLDRQVVVSPPVIKFTPAVLQMSTQRAIRQAMTVAQATAAELVGTQKPPNVILGPLIYAVQDSCTIQSMNEYASSLFETFKWKVYNKRVNCKVTVVFEILNKQGKRVV